MNLAIFLGVLIPGLVVVACGWILSGVVDGRWN